eukprot:8126776-Heterocapsa_arctica.AAC.1
MKRLVDRLMGMNLFTYKKRANANIGVFRVVKKDESLRLVFDCRPTNALCEPPPRAHLATAGALTHLDLSGEYLCRDAPDARQLLPVPPGLEPPALEASFPGIDLTD